MNKRILAIDALGVLRNSVAGILPQSGFLVAGAMGSAQAIDILRTEKFDVVVVDHATDGMNGFQLIEAISTMRARPSIVVVASSNEQLRQDIRDHALAYSVNLLAILDSPVQSTPLTSALIGVAELGGGDGEGASTSIAETEFMRGLMTDGLSPVFQPKICLKTGAIVGAEAFARWNAPSGGLLGAGAVIKVARENGHMDVLTYRMLELALQQQGKWLREGKSVPLSINTASENLRKADFADVVSGLAEQFDVPPEMICLEVTEADFEVSKQVPLENLARLHARGFGLALDDFGAGFAPLMQLKEIPFDELVIDRTFLAHASENETARIVFETAVELAHKLGLSCTVEGVETAAHLDMAQRIGADKAQGYHVGKPMSAKEFLIWIEDFDDDIISISGLSPEKPSSHMFVN